MRNYLLRKIGAKIAAGYLTGDLEQYLDCGLDLSWIPCGAADDS
jgi:hypothetical protein